MDQNSRTKHWVISCTNGSEGIWANVKVARTLKFAVFNFLTFGTQIWDKTLRTILADVEIERLLHFHVSNFCISFQSHIWSEDVKGLS